MNDSPVLSAEETSAAESMLGSVWGRRVTVRTAEKIWGRSHIVRLSLEECYLNQACLAAQFLGSSQYGITCTGLHGRTPCGWDDFTTDATARQPTGKWVGEAEYAEDNYVCNPGQRCQGPHAFSAFCHAVYSPPYGFAAVKFDVNLDGGIFYPCS